MMTERQLTNAALIPILNGLGDEVGQRLRDKRLPARLLYALHRNLPEVRAAYRAYGQALAELCRGYGVTLETLDQVAPERKAELERALAELLAQETAVRLHPVSPRELERCGQEGYDALTYDEVERLAWLLEEAP